MKFASVLPQPLPQECAEASKIFRTFVTPRGDYGLGKVIPGYVLQQAKGFVIISATKAAPEPSSRASPGLVIARLPDGTFSAPSAIRIAGTVPSTPRGAKLEVSLIVLNSTSAVQSFMSAASFTLGGNLSLAVGPLGRGDEAGRAGVGAKEQVVDMYLYSGTKEPFVGREVGGWTISARHNANIAAYKREVTSKQLLSGGISAPQWAEDLNQTITQAVGDGMPSGKEPASRVSTTVQSQKAASLVRHKNTTSLSPANNLNNDGLTGEYVDPHSVRSSNPKDRPSLRNTTQSRPGGTSPAAWARTGRNSSNISAVFQQKSPTMFALESRPDVTDSITACSYSGMVRFREAIALDDYSASEGGEISFSKGETFYVMEGVGTMTGGSWWEGWVCADPSRKGLIPSRYVKLLNQ